MVSSILWTSRRSMLSQFLIAASIFILWICVNSARAAEPITPCIPVKCVVGRCFLEQQGPTGKIVPVCKNLPAECVCRGRCYITKRLDKKGRCPECICP